VKLFACLFMMAAALSAAVPAAAEDGAQQFADMGICTLDKG
jgi:hypothetical protein